MTRYLIHLLLLVTCLLTGCGPERVRGTWTGVATTAELFDPAGNGYRVAQIDVDDGTAVHDSPWPGNLMVGPKYLVDDRMRALPAASVNPGQRYEVRGTIVTAFAKAPTGDHPKIGPSAQRDPNAVSVIIVQKLRAGL